MNAFHIGFAFFGLRRFSAAFVFGFPIARTMMP
jgi:hypothetical protein